MENIPPKWPNLPTTFLLNVDSTSFPMRFRAAFHTGMLTPASAYLRDVDDIVGSLVWKIVGQRPGFCLCESTAYLQGAKRKNLRQRYPRIYGLAPPEVIARRYKIGLAENEVNYWM